MTNSFMKDGELTETELALLESEAKLRAVIESTGVTITVLDLERHVLYVNHLVPGISMDEYIESVVDQWLGPDLTRQVIDNMAEVVESKEPAQYENNFTDPEGHTHYYYHIMSPIVSQGEVTGVSIVSNEVTQLKQLEIELRRKNEELERNVSELKQFAYIASHDLQEPLRTVNNFASLLQQNYQGRLDQHADKYIEFIAQSATRMSVLIKGLLDYSRIGHDGKKTTIDCNDLLKKILEDLSYSISQTNATFEVTKLPQLSGYKTELRLLFQNLIANAIKFRKQGVAPHIRITAHEESGHWIFAIRDNGIGIAPEHQQRIFAIFQRLHTSKEYEGTGIGLAHCRKIVELHGGKLWVESQPEDGSTFYFTIPR